jgi:prepilin-type N-terminal cleavage/methylation domain-containing protein
LRGAFSLIELLIVVVIIGLVYSLALPNFELLQRYKQTPVSLASLPEFLQNIPHEQSISFLCIDACKECFVLSDDARVKEYDAAFKNFLTDDVALYTYDMAQGMQKKELGFYFKDAYTSEELCFAYTINEQKKGNELFISYHDKVYDYTSVFNPKVYVSLQEASDARVNFEKEVLE